MIRSESLYVQDMIDWEAVAKAYELVNASVVNRIDGNGWKLYRVGQVIRLDVAG